MVIDLIWANNINRGEQHFIWKLMIQQAWDPAEYDACHMIQSIKVVLRIYHEE